MTGGQSIKYRVTKGSRANQRNCITIWKFIDEDIEKRLGEYSGLDHPRKDFLDLCIPLIKDETMIKS